MGCGMVVLNLESSDPCGGTCDNQICVAVEGGHECVDRPSVSLKFVSPDDDNDHHFLVNRQPFGVGQFDFRLQSGNGSGLGASDDFLIEVGHPVFPDGIVRAGVSPDEIRPIEGLSCNWQNADGSDGVLDIRCGSDADSFEAIKQELELGTLVLRVKYRVADDESGQDFDEFGYVRVLGTKGSIGKPVITRVVRGSWKPFSSGAYAEAQFIRGWVQVAFYDPELASDTAYNIDRIEADLTIQDLDVPEDGTAEIAFSAGHDLKGFGGTLNSAQAPRWHWIKLDVSRQDGLAGSSITDLDITVSGQVGGVTGTDRVIDEVVFPDDSPRWVVPESVVGLADLHFSTSPAGIPSGFSSELALVGLGPNLGGYVIQAPDGENYQGGTPETPVSVPLPVEPMTDVVLSLISGQSDGSTTPQTVTVKYSETSMPAMVVNNHKFRWGYENGQDTLTQGMDDVQRILWDPVSQMAIVVGQYAVEFFKRETTNNGETEFESLGVNNNVCGGGTILDGTIAWYSNGSADALGSTSESSWSSKLVLITRASVGQNADPLHCSLPLGGLTGDDVDSLTWSVIELGNAVLNHQATASCHNDINWNSSAELAVAFDVIGQSYTLLTNNCLISYYAYLDASGNTQTGSISVLEFASSNYVGPVKLTLDPHSGVAIGEFYEASYGYYYKRFITGRAPQAIPEFGSFAEHRDQVIYDPVRGWTWELITGTTDAGMGFGYIYPSVGSLNQSAPGFGDTWGVKWEHAVLDATHGVFHIASEASGILHLQAKKLSTTWSSTAVDRDVNISISGSDSGTGDSGSSAGNVVQDMVLMGPQVYGGLASAIHPNEVVTLTGVGFSGDPNQDKACVQGVCVEPIRTSPTSITFRVPDTFEYLDYPQKAYVTVFDGHFMSGPAPGESKLLPHWNRFHYVRGQPQAFSCPDEGCGEVSFIDSANGGYYVLPGASGVVLEAVDQFGDGNVQVTTDITIDAHSHTSVDGQVIWSSNYSPDNNSILLRETHFVAPITYDASTLPTPELGEVFASAAGYAENHPVWQHSIAVTSSLGGVQDVILSPDQSTLGVLDGTSLQGFRRRTGILSREDAWSFSRLDAFPVEGGYLKAGEFEDPILSLWMHSASLESGEPATEIEALCDFGGLTVTDFTVGGITGTTGPVHGIVNFQAQIDLADLPAGHAGVRVGIVVIRKTGESSYAADCRVIPVNTAASVGEVGSMPNVGGLIAIAPSGEFVAATVANESSMMFRLLKVSPTGIEEVLHGDVEEVIGFNPTGMYFSDSARSLRFVSNTHHSTLQLSYLPGTMEPN